MMQLTGLVIACVVACQPTPKAETVTVREASSASASVAAPSPSASASAAPRVDTETHRFGSIAVLTPKRIFTRVAESADALELGTNVFENYMNHRSAFGMKLSIVTSAFGELRTLLDSQFTLIFPDGTEKSFKPDPGFVDRWSVNGAKGYVMSRGVEGIGEVFTLLVLPTGVSVRIECDYCCGLVPKPKLTRDEQMAICDRVIARSSGELQPLRLGDRQFALAAFGSVVTGNLSWRNDARVPNVHRAIYGAIQRGTRRAVARLHREAMHQRGNEHRETVYVGSARNVTFADTTLDALCDSSLGLDSELVQILACLLASRALCRAVESAENALITGGTTGIGFATARILHERNYAVVVTGQNPERIAAATKALPRDVVLLRADVRVLADTQAVADEIRTRYGRLVHCS